MARPHPRVADPELHALEHALDPDRMQEILERATAPRLASAYEAEILSHKFGARCTIQYTPVGRRAGGVGSGAVIGKLYRSRRRAARMYRRQVELGSCTFTDRSRTCLPAALEFVEELGLVLQAHVEGVDLRDFLTEDAGVAPMELAGRWLAQLHASDPPAEIKNMSAAGRVVRMRGWAAKIAGHLSFAEKQRLVRGLECAALVLGRVSAENRPVLIHKDFYYANLLWDGLRIWGLDLDELSLGDAAFDVGHFLAHLERHAWRSGISLECASVAGGRFLHEYERHAGESARAATPFYKAYTFVKLAATEVARKRVGWEHAMRMLAASGCRELEEFASS